MRSWQWESSKSNPSISDKLFEGYRQQRLHSLFRMFRWMTKHSAGRVSFVADLSEQYSKNTFAMKTNRYIKYCEDQRLVDSMNLIVLTSSWLNYSESYGANRSKQTWAESVSRREWEQLFMQEQTCWADKSHVCNMKNLENIFSLLSRWSDYQHSLGTQV